MNVQKPFAITLDPASSLLNRTGSWRTERPIYVSRMPPCNHTCPAGEAIQSWLALAEEERYEEAWRKIMEENPLPVMMGRVCYHPCENACNRGQVDEAVGINSVERFLGDQALIHRWRIEPGPDSGKRVMVIGAGPAGLAAAYHLRRFGHAVTIFDASPKPGGMVRYGIPKYRMPREKLTAEIARIQEMGVDIQCDTRIDDVMAAKREGNYDAVFLGIGAQLAKSVEIPVSGGMPVLNALEVLRDTELERPTRLHGRVVVYGGGNTAMDVARSAIRLGALKATVVMLEAREHMMAHESEVKETEEEGAELVPLRSVRNIDGSVLHLEKMTATNDRWPRPRGVFEDMEGDVFVQAIGQSVELEFLETISGIVLEEGRARVDKNMRTDAEGVFAGGDMIASGGSVTAAIGHGKKAARNIDAFLRGVAYAPPERSEPALLEHMEPWYYSDAPRSHRPRLDVVRRTSGFAEVVGNLDE